MSAGLTGILPEALVEERWPTFAGEWHWWVDDWWGKNRVEITSVRCYHFCLWLLTELLVICIKYTDGTQLSSDIVNDVKTTFGSP